MWRSSSLLDRLFKISGKLTINPKSDDFRLVAGALHDASAEVRERAIFIGALRWKDPTIVGYLYFALVTDAELDENNRRLIIESLVSASLSGQLDSSALERELLATLRRVEHSQLEAKAAFVGLQRIRGLMSTSEWAVNDYGRVVVDIGVLDVA